MAHMTASSPIGIVCGSGIELRALLDEVHAENPLNEIIPITETAVAGHPGKLIQGRCGDTAVLLQCGRLHLYEGHDYATVISPVDLMHRLGANTIVFTNAAGGLKPEMAPGELMAATTIRPWPYAGWSDQPPELDTDFAISGCDTKGIYTWVHGPCYETRAEIAALQTMKADAVGMSTAPEVARCREIGIRTAVVSCITNNCCHPQVLTHEHVVSTAKKLSARLVRVMRAAIQEMVRQNP